MEQKRKLLSYLVMQLSMTLMCSTLPVYQQYLEVLYA